MTNESDRNGQTEAESKDARSEGVRRMLNSEDAPQEPDQPMGVVTGEGKEPPEGVGESITRRGEDVVDRDGGEAGRFDTGTDGTPADRPTGGSTARDATGVDPQDPVVDTPILSDEENDD